MKKYGCLVCVALFAFNAVQAQIDEEIDSTKVVGLDNVVITGQYSAQSVDKSIYKVEVITAEDIKNFAGNTVADILNQNLNIFIQPNKDDGRSTVNVLGLGGNYTKILIDNIPLVGDNGMGVDIDLTQINVDNIERIEIVKGAMGVDYGNNALTGIINIITKKSLSSKWKVSTFLQEESINDEYDWYEDGGLSKGKGRHIQGLEIAHNISDKWFASVGVNRNDFQGYWNDKKGSKDYSKMRGYDWQPKEQWNANAVVNFKSKNFKAFYKLSYLLENINFYDDSVRPFHLGQGQQTYRADDRDYRTNRWVHHLNIDTKLFNRVKFIGDFSYQNQDREVSYYLYDIPTRTEVNRDDFKSYASSEAFYSRGTFSNFLDTDNFDFQVGYEVDQTKGFRGKTANNSNVIDGEAFFAEDINRTLGTYAAFASAEFRTNVGLALRPGIRANFSNKFDSQLNLSLSSRFDLSPSNSLRAVVGTTNRYPNFDELYTYFVDSNHDVRGNLNLQPEKGYSTSIQWDYNLRKNEFRMQNSISTIYLDLQDKIELATINFNPLQYMYINIDEHKTWGITTDHQFTFNNLNVNLGASYIGISRSFENNGGVEVKDDFRYTLEANASANYMIPKWGTTISAYYKYIGKLTQYVLEDPLGTPYYRLGEQEPFSMMDASIRKSFFDRKLELTLGIRNIFDVTSVTNTTQAGSLHGAAPNDVMLFYGRSYFLKLNYILNFN
ncbi:TonB-dependent receptor plug domain-containing protein [Moheibacter sediminis]|uniref:Outer membrane receptor for ferrienterochelin and colicins n=1 Tax=Moheibacter sediminis TaxID=1434700 RepID=A0A1W2CV21_9FLAO|nr:TonB-dependent receptor [Moheibacter sediminis]SMC88816.1 outer membrane receptor for ferrienterochelin and colicins [Moheibacter sediminis]